MTDGDLPNRRGDQHNPEHYDGYNPGDRLAAVTARPGAVGPILVAIDADDVTAVLDAMWEIGNRVTGDLRGRGWPRDVRSLSTGDVLVVFAPGYPLQTRHVDTYAVAATGFDLVAAPDPSVWVSLDGAPGMSRPSANQLGPSVWMAPPASTPSRQARL